MSGFPACSRDARRPGEVSAPGLAVLLGRAWAAASRGVAFPAVVLHPAAVSHAPAQFSSTQEQETAPAPPGNKLSQPLPRKKNYPGNPGRPVAAVARAAPGVAGGSRGGPSRRPMLAGMNASTAPPLPPTPCAGCVSRCGLRLGSFALPGRCSLRPHVTWRRTAAPSPFTWQVARHSPQCGRLRCKIQLPSARPHVYRAKLNTAALARIYPALPSKCQQRALYVRAGETWHRRRGKGAAVAAGASFLIDSTKLNRVHRDRTDDQSL